MYLSQNQDFKISKSSLLCNTIYAKDNTLSAWYAWLTGTIL